MDNNHDETLQENAKQMSSEDILKLLEKSDRGSFKQEIERLYMASPVGELIGVEQSIEMVKKIESEGKTEVDADRILELLREAKILSKEASQAFSDFYLNRVEEAFKTADLRDNHQIITSNSIPIARMARHANQQYESVRERVFRELHDYIREHGIPVVFPRQELNYQTMRGIETKEKRSVIFGLPFHIEAGTFPVKSNYDDFSGIVFARDLSDKAFYTGLKVPLRKELFLPTGPYGGYYSKSYSQQLVTEKELNRRLNLAQEDIDKAESGLYLSHGFLLFDILLLPFRFVGTLLKAIFCHLFLLVVLFGLNFVFQLCWTGTPIVKIGVAVVSAIILLFLLAAHFEEEWDTIAEGFVNFNDRRHYRAMRAQAKREYSKHKSELNGFVSSPEYVAAQKEEERLKAEDQELAKKWQDEWIRQLQKSKPEWLLL